LACTAPDRWRRASELGAAAAGGNGRRRCSCMRTSSAAAIASSVLQRQYARDDVVGVVNSGSRAERVQGRRVIMRAGMGQERKVAPSRFRQGLRGRHAALTHRQTELRQPGQRPLTSCTTAPCHAAVAHPDRAACACAWGACPPLQLLRVLIHRCCVRCADPSLSVNAARQAFSNARGLRMLLSRTTGTL
jgi:hypothetical protein